LSKKTQNKIKDLPGDSHSKDKAENYKTLDQKDVRVAERLEALAVMPVWLWMNQMQKSLQEFSEIAKYFLPVKNGELK
jgi:hypothetical protein